MQMAGAAVRPGDGIEAVVASDALAVSTMKLLGNHHHVVSIDEAGVEPMTVQRGVHLREAA
jgi:hypothetical protein